MKKENILFQGAEAHILKTKSGIIKRRIKKNYRFEDIDNKIRKSRTRREAKIINKISKKIPVPEIIKVDETKKEILMTFIKGDKLSEKLNTLKDNLKICQTIGKNISTLHDSDIIHGDLTTSNMIYNKTERKVYFIDFGLSYTSSRIEDKAVDIHLIKEALNAKHFPQSEKFFSSILKGYKSSENSKKVLEQLKKVESRGRYKQQ